MKLVLATTDQFDTVLIGHDATIESETFGKDVVETTINKILHSGIFEDDMVFLRRLACVESSYGTEAETYRSGYHGGIWQVCLIMFIPFINMPGKACMMLHDHIQYLYFLR